MTEGKRDRGEGEGEERGNQLWQLLGAAREGCGNQL